MRYIISESRLNQFINEYLESFLKDKSINRILSLILVQESPIADDDEEFPIDYIEYDYDDGRLWLNRNFLTNISDLFFKDNDDAIKFMTEWFENRFNVEVKFTQL